MGLGWGGVGRGRAGGGVGMEKGLGRVTLRGACKGFTA